MFVAHILEMRHAFSVIEEQYFNKVETYLLYLCNLPFLPNVLTSLPYYVCTTIRRKKIQRFVHRYMQRVAWVMLMCFRSAAWTRKVTSEFKETYIRIVKTHRLSCPCCVVLQLGDGPRGGYAPMERRTALLGVAHSCLNKFNFNCTYSRCSCSFNCFIVIIHNLKMEIWIVTELRNKRVIASTHRIGMHFF